MLGCTTYGPARCDRRFRGLHGRGCWNRGSRRTWREPSPRPAARTRRIGVDIVRDPALGGGEEGEEAAACGLQRHSADRSYEDPARRQQRRDRSPRFRIFEVMGYANIAGMPVVTGLVHDRVADRSVRVARVRLDISWSVPTRQRLQSWPRDSRAWHWIAPPQYVQPGRPALLMVGGILIIARLVRLGFLADSCRAVCSSGSSPAWACRWRWGSSRACSAWRVDGRNAGRSSLPRGEGGSRHEPVWTPRGDAERGVVVILGAKKIDKRISGRRLIAVVGSIFVSWHWNLVAHGVSTLGMVPSGLPSLGFPRRHAQFQQLVGTVAAAISHRDPGAERGDVARVRGEVLRDCSTRTARPRGARAREAAAGLSGTFVVNGSPN